MQLYNEIMLKSFVYTDAQLHEIVNPSYKAI